MYCTVSLKIPVFQIFAQMPTRIGIRLYFSPSGSHEEKKIIDSDQKLTNNLCF
jgi:hypothetical protein